ncbi:MAG: hypothetical protein ACLVD7_06590 [[Clostridium] leptum]
MGIMLYRLPGSYGCLVFNKSYPVDMDVSLPEQDAVLRILDKIRTFGASAYKTCSDHEHINRLVAWYSKYAVVECGTDENKNRVAVSDHIIRAYFSQCWNCKNCSYDCQGTDRYSISLEETNKIRGPCRSVDITKIAKEYFTYEQTG